MVERGDHQVRTLRGMIHMGRTQQRQITHVGQSADVQQRIVGQRIPVFEPHLLLGHLSRLHGDEFPRNPPDVPFGELRKSVFESALRQIIWRYDGGHDVLMLDTDLLGLERRADREDDLTVLDGVHTAGGEGSAVTRPVDEIDRGFGRITGTQEVAVQRVHVIFRVDGA